MDVEQSGEPILIGIRVFLLLFVDSQIQTEWQTFVKPFRIRTEFSQIIPILRYPWISANDIRLIKLQ